MDPILDIVVTGGGFVLALMGVVMSFNPPSKEDRRKQWKWFWGFAIVGVLVTVAQFWSNARDRAAQVALERKLTGADNFCYFRVQLDKRQLGGGYEWQLINKEQRPIPGVQMCRYRIIDGKERFVGCWDQSMCIPHSINQTTAGEKPIMAGKHRFVFFAANTWEQVLQISEGAMSAQTGVIYRDGKEIWRFPPP